MSINKNLSFKDEPTEAKPFFIRKRFVIIDFLALILQIVCILIFESLSLFGEKAIISRCIFYTTLFFQIVSFFFLLVKKKQSINLFYAISSVCYWHSPLITNHLLILDTKQETRLNSAIMSFQFFLFASAVVWLKPSLKFVLLSESANLLIGVTCAGLLSANYLVYIDICVFYICIVAFFIFVRRIQTKTESEINDEETLETLVLNFCQTLSIMVKTNKHEVFSDPAKLFVINQKRISSAQRSVKKENEIDTSDKSLVKTRTFLNNLVKLNRIRKLTTSFSDAVSEAVECSDWHSALTVLLNETSDENFTCLIGVVTIRESEFSLYFHKNKADGLLCLIDLTLTFKEMKSTFYKETTKKLVNKISHEVKNPAVILNEISSDLIYMPKPNFKKIGHSVKLNSLLIIYNLKYFEYLYFLDENTTNNLQTSLVFTELDEIDFVFTSLATNSVRNINFKFLADRGSDLKLKLDYDKLRMILFLLLSNAFKFTNYGDITLKLNVVKEVKYSDKIETTVKFEVYDSGGGLSPQIKQNLFMPNTYEVRNNNSYGIGNGLYICKKLCEQMKSNLSHTDNPPLGSMFYFELLSIVEIFKDDETVIESFDPFLAKRQIFQETMKFGDKSLVNSELVMIFGDRNATTLLPETQEAKNKEFNKLNSLKKLKTLGDRRLSQFSSNGQRRSSFIPYSVFKPSMEILEEIPEKIAENPLNKHIDYKQNYQKESHLQSFSSISSVKFLDVAYHRICNGDEAVLNVMLTDDDLRIRKQMLSLFEKSIKTLSKKVTLHVYECCDGLESLAVLYNFYKKGSFLNLMITDETMNFMNGSFSVTVIQMLVESKIINSPNVYFCTAYSNTEEIAFLCECEQVKGVYSKPMKMSDMIEILENLI